MKKIPIIQILKSILFGLIEGLTEWLPISSSTHIELADQILRMNATAGFFFVFEVVIQLGAIAAVIVVYFQRLWPFHTKKNAPEKSQFANPEEGGAVGGFQRFADNYLYMDKVVLWLKILISVLPAAILGLILDDFRDQYLNNWLVIGIMMLVYGALFVLIELFFMPGGEPDDIDFASYDYVVDAVDTVTAKLYIIERAREAGVPVISSMGTGNKLDGSAFRITTIEIAIYRIIQREAATSLSIHSGGLRYPTLIARFSVSSSTISFGIYSLVSAVSRFTVYSVP